MGSAAKNAQESCVNNRADDVFPPSVQWKDKVGREWTGGLVKPPDYVSGHRYPLVIQTHGFNQHEFMTVGAFTTAFAARPIAATGIIVQSRMPTLCVLTRILILSTFLWRISMGIRSCE